jgi:hypothetical protein
VDFRRMRIPDQVPAYEEKLGSLRIPNLGTE